MSRKDYVILAAALLFARKAAQNVGEVAGVNRAVESVADALADDNRRFHRVRFYLAAGAVSLAADLTERGL